MVLPEGKFARSLKFRKFVVTLPRGTPGMLLLGNVLLGSPPPPPQPEAISRMGKRTVYPRPRVILAHMISSLKLPPLALCCPGILWYFAERSHTSFSIGENRHIPFRVDASRKQEVRRRYRKGEHEGRGHQQRTDCCHLAGI